MWQKIKLILKSVRQYKKYALITPLFMVLEALLECIMPFTMSMLIDSVNNAVKTGIHFTMTTPIPYVNQNLGMNFNVTVLALILILLGIVILSIFSGIMGGIFGAKASVGFATNLRADIFKKIQSFSFSNIDKFSTSSLVTRTTTDINQIQMSFQMLIRIVVRAPLMMVFSAVMAFITGGVMACIFVVLIPVVAFGLFLIGKNAMRIFTRVFKRYDKLNESVQENVSGIRVVKSYVREDFEKQKFNNASNNLSFDFIKAEKIVALNNPLINTVIHLSNIAVLTFGSIIYWKSHTETGYWASIEIGQISALLTYGIQILMNIMMISMILVMLFISLEAVKRVSEVLMEEPTIKDPENPLFEVTNGDIDFKNVNFKYKDTAEKCALENINISIKSGEFVGILSSTGSGKTSFVNLISRLYDVTDGEVIVGDHNVKEYDLKALRDNVSVVLQKNVLFSGTIASNLRWGNPDATEEEMKRACEIAQCYEIVKAKEKGFDSVVEHGGANFSGGQKQRLCIARAILRKPKIMILDDSTSAVDTRTDKLIRKGLKEDLPYMTKIVIAQRISSIEDADKIIIMDNGQINAVGTHEELIKSNKIYQEVYYSQNRVGGNK